MKYFECDCESCRENDEFAHRLRELMDKMVEEGGNRGGVEVAVMCVAVDSWMGRGADVQRIVSAVFHWCMTDTPARALMKPPADANIQ